MDIYPSETNYRSFSNSFECRECIKHVSIAPDECMVSLDAVSLFISISLGLARETIIHILDDYDLGLTPLIRSICWIITHPTTSSSTAVSASRSRAHQWVPQYLGLSPKRCYKDSKGRFSQSFPPNSENVMSMIHLWLLRTSQHKANRNQFHDGDSSRKQTTFLGCINSHPGWWQLDATTKMFLSASKVVLYNSSQTVIIRGLVWKNRYAPGPYGLEKYWRYYSNGDLALLSNRR